MSQSSSSSRLYSPMTVSAAIGLIVIIASVIASFQPVVLASETVALSGPPDRPNAFKNQDEVKDYLRALNDYFSIVGRPRFGRKRSDRSPLSYLDRYRLQQAAAAEYEMDD